MSVEIGKRYTHYKNGEEYTVLNLGRLEADPTIECVVYRAEYDSPDFGMGAVWIRPRENFEGLVELNGKLVPRFTRVDVI